LKTAIGIFWFALGGVLGWPFSMALCAPFLFEAVLFASLTSKDDFIDAIMSFLRGFVSGLLVLVSYYKLCPNLKIFVLTKFSYSNFWYPAFFTRNW